MDLHFLAIVAFRTALIAYVAMGFLISIGLIARVGAGPQSEWWRWLIVWVLWPVAIAYIVHRIMRHHDDSL